VLAGIVREPPLGSQVMQEFVDPEAGRG
jgi:hypothetical protein